MIESSDIKKYAKHIFSRSKGYAEKQIIHPQREWLFILFGFLILFIVGVVHGIYQFQYFQQYPDTVIAQTELTLPQYQGRMVEQTHLFYQERADRFEQYLQNTPEIVIPLETDAATTSSILGDELELELEVGPEESSVFDEFEDDLEANQLSE